MKVCLDARFIGFAGIGRFVEELWRELAKLDVDVVGLYPGAAVRDWRGSHRPPATEKHDVVPWRPFGPGEQLGLPRWLTRNRISVYHSPHLTVPYLSSVPAVLTVHGTSPIRDPAIAARSRLAAAYYRVAFPAAVRKAALVVAISQWCANDVHDTLGVPQERLRVVEMGLDHETWRPRSEAEVQSVQQRYGLPQEYLLYVGTAKAHKNLATLLRALRPHHPPLVLAGPTPQELASLRDGAAGHAVHPLGRVDNETLAALYTGALLLAMPSLHETVPFPTLEAMGCGCPVVASDVEGLPSTLGAAGVLLPALDIEAWSEVMSDVSGDPHRREMMRQAGYREVAPRSWRACAHDYLAIYRELASAR